MCKCGCNTCETKKPVMLNESVAPKEILSEGLKYHIDNARPLTEHVYRAGSKSYFNLWAEARALYSRNIIEMQGDDLEVITETDLGHFGLYEGKKVPLDFIFEEELDEAEKKKTPALNKPKRGGAKKFYVYVRDPKTKKVKKVSFGAAGGGQNLSVKIKDPKARAAFSKRHNCPQKTDKTKPSYWSCRVGRYWKMLGGDKNFSGFW
jgi:hypothetical protein